jgi:hypothetical protein
MRLSYGRCLGRRIFATVADMSFSPANLHRHALLPAGRLPGGGGALGPRPGGGGGRAAGHGPRLHRRLAGTAAGLKEEYGERLQLHFAPDKGQSDAINRGMALARGNVLAWLNSDDRYHPGALSEVAGYLDSPEPRWLYGRCGIIDGERPPDLPADRLVQELAGAALLHLQAADRAVHPPDGLVLEPGDMGKGGGVDVDRHMDMDYDLHLHFARIARPKVSSAYLADSRVHPEAKSSTRTFEGIDAVAMTARQHAVGLGWRGQVAVLMHRLYGLRTKTDLSI